MGKDNIRIRKLLKEVFPQMTDKDLEASMTVYYSALNLSKRFNKNRNISANKGAAIANNIRTLITLCLVKDV